MLWSQSLSFFSHVSCAKKEMPFLGTAGTGAHAVRVPIADVALFDTTLTVLFAYALARGMHWPFWAVLLGLVALSIPAHALVHVDSRLLRLVRDI